MAFDPPRFLNSGDSVRIEIEGLGEIEHIASPKTLAPGRLRRSADAEAPSEHASTTSILAIYFVVVLGIGFVARLAIKTDLDFFLSGRSLPAWITGLAFIAANLGALEILGQAANGAQYGVPRSTTTGSAPCRPWCSWAS